MAFRGCNEHDIYSYFCVTLLLLEKKWIESPAYIASCGDGISSPWFWWTWWIWNSIERNRSKNKEGLQFENVCLDFGVVHKWRHMICQQQMIWPPTKDKNGNGCFSAGCSYNIQKIGSCCFWQIWSLSATLPLLCLFLKTWQQQQQQKEKWKAFLATFACELASSL